MAVFITRQSIEGDQIITTENVGDVQGLCWIDGAGQYIPNSIILVINGIDYPVAAPSFFGFGHMHVNVPPNLVLKAGDTVRLKSSCSSEDSQAVTTLEINLQLITSNASTCNNTAPIKTVYSDRIRLFLGEGNTGAIFNLSMNGKDLNVPEFFSQVGSVGVVTSSAGDFTPDPETNTILFSNALYNPTAELSAEVVNSESYFTIRLGYIEIVFDFGDLNVIDYISGSELDGVGGGITNGDTIKVSSTPTTYSVLKNDISFFSVQKSVDYILPSGAGSITPDPSVAGVDSTWTLPTTPGTYPIQVKLGDQITAEASVIISSCPLHADPKSINGNKGSVDNVIPPLTGSAPNNCTVTGFKIKSLPACGTLKLRGSAVTLNQNILAADADDLRIDIPANCPGSSLTFSYSSVSTLPGCQESANALVTVTLIDATADAKPDAFSGPKGFPIAHNISNNDIYCSVGNTFYELITGSAQKGTVTSFDQNSGAATFIPATPDYVGAAEYKYNIRCGLTFADSVVKDNATVNLFFFGGNAVDDVNSTYKDVPVSGNVSTNDTATCEGATTYSLLSGSEKNGTVSAFNQSTGAYTFVPAAGYLGSAGEFRYNLLCDGVTIGSATVRINVNGAVLEPDKNTTSTNVPIAGTIRGNDHFICSEPVSFAMKPDSEINGTVTSFSSTTGEYIFLPLKNYNGTAEFTYEAFCASTKVGETRVVITVLPSCDICKELHDIKAILHQLLCNDITIIKQTRF